MYCTRKLSAARPASIWMRALQAALFVFALLLSYSPLPSSSAQGAITGQWIIETRPGTDYIHLTVQRSSGRHTNFMSSVDVRRETLKGLLQAQAASGGPVQFQIVRDAGTLNCEGWFKDGKGSGHFTFAPNQGFAGEMRGLGYNNLSEEDLFTMTVVNLTVDFIRELGALGYERLALDDLMAMRIHGAGPEFIRELKSRGFDRLPVDDLVAMRIHGVTPDFMNEVESLGYKNVEIDDLVAMRIHGVSPEFIKSVEAQGYKRPPLDDLVAMRIHGVTPAFIQKMRERGFKDITIDQLIELKIHGFDR
ncbi:MAG TPA: hypothetical protein VNO70_20355 [Blastocatellia bacterium]|nr:hypothetical protein [Blastocatellia bacterium]